MELVPAVECDGVTILSGIDTDGDGSLSESEVNQRESVCAGVLAATTLVTTEPATECDNGGIAIHTGTDENTDGILQELEYVETTWICDSENTVSIVSLSDAKVSFCPHGGTLVSSGQDVDGNGELDPSEISASQMVCDDGISPIVEVVEAPLDRCRDGGVIHQIGYDSYGMVCSFMYCYW